MVLPPGQQPRPVAGINAATDPELAAAAAELNAWIDYLLRPESHDGPRIYRATGPDRSGHVPTDAEMPQRIPSLDQDTAQYVTVSVIDGYSADPGVFFRPAQAVSGVSDTVIEPTYRKIAKGYFTGTDPQGKTAGKAPDVESPVDATRYKEMHPVRMNWFEVRNSWLGLGRLAANEYENDVIRYQVYTENCFYVLAEHLVRYRAIFHKASEDMAALMRAMTKTFAQHDWYHSGGGGVILDLFSVAVTGLVAGVTMVISGGATAPTAAKLLQVVVVEAIGEAMKTAKEGDKKNQLLIEDQRYLRDSAKQYLDAVTKIERDTAQAVTDLHAKLRTKLDELRSGREYSTVPNSAATSMSVPRYHTYFEAAGK
ncbi:hypothetical protein ALI144C_23580 [Actinosynnema sp. ALI-1.44]|uniref:hypothetical protein n=1 Tax=Actinosynnema sp. ALI-1.44 TaxID=1933779 RepID=UPI00097BABE5|nr:hypothetical protein [Actinosynnema sp. ALI-1.44]ONI79737.1 hypothetical protein ALI144C_23580 [Actinosynnema sp. ALI-1.44]